MARASSSSEAKQISIPSKSDKLAELLEEVVGQGRFTLGERFFSTYQIARKYGVSTGTARKALTELVCKGLLEPSHRSGHFLRQLPPISRPFDGPVAPPRKAKVSTTVMAIVGSPGQWGDRLLDQYLEGLELACGRVGWRMARVNNHAQEIERVCESSELAGCLAYGLLEPPAAKIDPSSIVLWSCKWVNPFGCVLDVDEEGVMRQAFEHLWDLGHQRTALVCPPDSNGAPQLKNGSILGMRKAYAGIGFTWRPEDVFFTESAQTEGLYDRICKAGITGVCCRDWRVVLELYRQARQQNEMIGERLSVVAAGGHDLAELVEPRPSRIYWRFEDFGEAVVEALSRLERGRMLPHRVNLPVFLKPGPGAQAMVRMSGK